MTEHLLTVERDVKHAKRFPDDDPEFDWFITCINPDKCNGWMECDKNHEGYNPDDGYDGEIEDVEIHGETHNFTYFGWTVEYPGCVVQGTDWEPPEELWPPREGKWIVEDEWDDEFCELLFIREA